MLKMPPNNGAQGFTLIELMIGIVIMGIVLALALPSYKAFIQNTRIRNTAESILNGLQLARLEAVRHNANVQFVLGVAPSVYLWSVGCVTATATCPALIQRSAIGEGSSTSIIVTPTPATIVFSNFGRLCTPMTVPSCPVTPATQLDVTVDPAVLSAAESRSLRITIGTIDAGGSVRMCDPDPTLPASDPRAC